MPAPKPNRFIVNSLLVAASVAVALTVVEFGIEQLYRSQVYGKFQQQGTVYNLAHFGYLVHEFDPRLGWHNTPDMEDTPLIDNQFFHYRHNREGMRYREVGPKHGYRVAVLGDSFIWGWLVNDGERFTDLIEQQDHIEMLNFGVTAYGTVQEYLQLPEVISHKPDLVILAFCVTNDFFDSVTNYGYHRYRPYASLEHGRLVLKGQPVPRKKDGVSLRHVPDWVLTRALWMLMVQRWFDFDSMLADRASPHAKWPLEGMTGLNAKGVYTVPRTGDMRKAMAIETALLRKMKEELATQGIEFVVFEVQASDDIGRPAAVDALRTVTKDAGVRLLMMPPMGREDFRPADPHWNTKGSRKVADYLGPIIEEYAQKKKDAASASVPR